MAETRAAKIARLETELAEARAARSAILKSQSYAKGDRQLSRARLAEVSALIAQLEAELARAEGGGIRVRRAVPIAL